MKAPYLLHRLDPTPLEALRPHFNALPSDRYVREGYRLRRLSRFARRGGRVCRTAPRPFVQSADTNPLFGDVERAFEELDEALLRSTALQEVVASFLDHGVEADQDVDVQVHMIRVRCTGDTPAHPAPEGVHRDGFDRIGILCVHVDNVSGGETRLFADPPRDPLLRHTLRPGELLIVDDRRLLHYTTPIEATERRAPGVRDMLILTASPP